MKPDPQTIEPTDTSHRTPRDRLPSWKSSLLSLYYHASLPYRWIERRKAALRGQVPIVSLFYHRVADDMLTPWTVSNAMFTRQIEWLRKRFELISLADAQRRIREGNQQRCVSLTFDDGYSDNCHHAIPLLVKHRIPCTYFVTLRNAVTGLPFEHDVAHGQRFAPNTLEQLRMMARAGIEIGLHCRNHIDVAQLASREAIEDEIVTAGRELAQAVGHPIRYFAFPFGQKCNLSPEAFHTARRAGYAGVCSAYGGYNLPGDDPFHIQRFHVDQGMSRLKNNVALDPRKMNLPRYDVSDTPGDVPEVFATPQETPVR